MQKFSRVMRQWRTDLDLQLEQGADNWVISQSLAYYEMLNSDIEAAVPHYVQALDQGLYPDMEILDYGSIFLPLLADERVKEAMAAMEARRDEELAQLATNGDGPAS